MRYPKGELVLKNVSFLIKPGQKVGLVGSTGSGKTTTVSLISRLYEYEDGQILIDGKSIRDYDRKSLRSQLGYVTQDAVIFRGTVRENLLAATEKNLTDPELLKIADKTGLAKLLNRLPKNLDTHLLDGGSNLSAGERQLINFTRMIIRDPSVMILDEATAHTDEKTEETLHEAMEIAMKDRSCLIIAHRLSTIKECDLLLVFDHGTLVEWGEPKTLLSNPGHYFSLAARQMELT
jgi:ABC-type multidrug transport system fused ATPase/permease subunit